MRSDALPSDIYLTSEKPYGFVLYTDGGCRPSRGQAGWGVHGYTYFLGNIPSLKTKTDLPTTEGYKDFAEFSGTEIKPVIIETYIDGWGSVPGEATNNIGELYALIEGFTFIEENNLKKGVFLLDSEYVIKGLLEYLPGWIKRDWITSSGKEVSNRTLWETVNQRHQDLIKKGFEIKFDWVKGHEDKGNIVADSLATKGIFSAKNGFMVQREFHSYKGNNSYWNPSFEYNRLFGKQRWYFTAGDSIPPVTKDGKYVYCTGSHGKDDETGKPISDLNFAVLFLNKKEPMLELLQKYHNRHCDTLYHNTVIGRLDTVLLPRVYTELQDYAFQFLYKQPDRNEIYFPTGEQLTMEVNPPRRVAKQNEMFNFMIDKLHQFRAGELVSTEITDTLFRIETNKKGVSKMKIQDEIQRVPSIQVPVKYKPSSNEEKFDTVTLTIGIDLPVRNILQGIAPLMPVVHVVTWRESDLAFRYGVVIDVNGDIGFWTGFYSNLKIIKRK